MLQKTYGKEMLQIQLTKKAAAAAMLNDFLIQLSFPSLGE
jgi:hypothetical protein